MASRIAARSTIAGTPVKSCISTRAGRYAISWEGSSFADHFATASAPSSSPFRSRFSSSTFSAYGRRATSYLSWRASSRKISYDSPPTSSVERAPKLSASLTY